MFDDESGADGSFELQFSLAKTLHKSVLKRWYVGYFNYNYIFTYYLFSKFSSRDDMPPAAQVLPSEVFRILSENKFASRMLEENGEDVVLKTENDVLELTRTRERATKLLRRYIPTGRKLTPQLKESLADWGTRYHPYFRPREFSCDKHCYGLPQGTKFLDLLVFPVINLRIMSINGRMKIVEAGPYIG